MNVHLTTDTNGNAIGILLNNSKIPLRRPIPLENTRELLQILGQLSQFVNIDALQIEIRPTLDGEYVRNFLTHSTPAQRMLIQILLERRGFTAKSQILVSMSRRRCSVGGGKGLSALSGGFTRTLRRDGIEIPIIEVKLYSESYEWAWKLNDQWREILREVIREIGG